MAIKRNLAEKNIEEVIVAKPKTITYIVNDLLNFRAKPEGKVLNTLAKGTEIEVESINNGWAKTTVNGQLGYVMEQFISIK